MKRSWLYSRILIAFFTCLCLLPREASATHAAGGELLYEWVRDSTYRFIFKFYRDCGGATEPSSFSLCYYSDCGAPQVSVPMQKSAVLGNGSEVSPGCPGYPSTCERGSLPGYREWIYSVEVELPSRCSKWYFYTALAARNDAVSNLNMTGKSNIFIMATLNNEAAQGNSSPYFSVKPIPYVCIHKGYTYNNGAVDVNADSLVFENANPMHGTVCIKPMNAEPVPYMPGFSLAEPFPTNGTFEMDTRTGQMNFIPSALSVPVLTTVVREYRNGVEIGSVMRDIQVRVIACDIPQPIIHVDTATMQNATLINDRIESCSNLPLSFCVKFKSPDTAAVLIATDNHASATPGATVTYSGQGTDSIEVCFAWSGGYLDTGLRVLTFSVKDSTCRPPGIPITQTFVVPVYIHAATGILRDTSLCPGETAQLVAAGGTNFRWGVLPGGDDITSLNCYNCTTVVASPTRTTYYTVIADNYSICNKNSDTVRVAVVTPPVIDLGPDLTTCINSGIEIPLRFLQSDTGTDYQVRWTPGTGLDDSTAARPFASPDQDTWYMVDVRPDGLPQCSTQDTIHIAVLQGFNMQNRDTIVCRGTGVPVRSSGDDRYTYAWTPVSGVSNPSSIRPVITPMSSNTYRLTATYPGCRDSIMSFFIEVQPVPSVNVGDDRILCYWDSLQLNAQVNPPDYPYYTYTWVPTENLNASNVPDPVFYAYETTTLTLTVSTPIGCMGTDDVLLFVVDPDIITVTPTDTLICPGDSIQVQITGNHSEVVWEPDYYISDPASFNPYVYPPVSVTYTVYGKDVNACSDTERVVVVIAPQAVIDLPDSVRIFPGEQYRMNPQGNSLYYTWFPTLGLSDPRISDPEVRPDVNTRYFVEGRTEYGCIANDSIDVYVSLDSYIDMPNVFSPGSQLNRSLKPVRRGSVQLKSFTVYNRWGVKLFETSDPDSGWDGTHGGIAQPMGVYVYMVEAVTPSGRVFNKQGNVTLIR